MLRLPFDSWLAEVDYHCQAMTGTALDASDFRLRNLYADQNVKPSKAAKLAAEAYISMIDPDSLCEHAERFDGLS